MTAEHGAVSVLLLVQLVLIGLFGLALGDAANVLLARSRAQAAADAAALAAGAEQWRATGDGRDPAAVAEVFAAVNGAALEGCDCPSRGDGVRVTVSVRTRVRMLGVAPPRVRASAEAAVDLGAVFRPPATAPPGAARSSGAGR